jgi:hypothetical protein
MADLRVATQRSVAADHTTLAVWVNGSRSGLLTVHNDLELVALEAVETALASIPGVRYDQRPQLLDEEDQDDG